MSPRTARTVRRRAAGVAFLLVPAVLVWVSVSVYDKDFTDDATVTVRTGPVGNEMHDNADVKLRGVVIGQVRSIATDGEGARLTLAIDPDKLEHIPADVTAQMLPTTLFGQRFVALVPPRIPSARTLSAGAVIPQDRSSNAIELEEVLGNVLPLLTAVKPEKLSATLGAVSQALEGRGEKLGETLTTLDAHLKKFNPQLPTLNEDIKQLVKVSTLYADAAPDVLDALTDATTTRLHHRRTGGAARRVVRHHHRLRARCHLLPAGEQGEPHPALLLRPPDARTPREVRRLVPLHAAYGRRVRARHGQGARQGDRRAGAARHGQVRARQGEVRPREGHPGLRRHRRPPLLLGAVRRQGGPDRGHPPGRRRHRTAPAQDTALGLPNSPQESQLVNELVAPSLKVQPQTLPDWSSVLIGPAFRGAEVKLK